MNVNQTDLDRWAANLERLSSELETDSGARFAASESRLARAKLFGDQVHLSHATSSGSFAAICESGSIFSPGSLLKRGVRVSRPETEIFMGTEFHLCLYAAPFRYPNTTSGFLFRGQLESVHSESGVSSPFDSGSLAHHVEITDGTHPQEFLCRHELPIPGHRQYLTQSLCRLFQEPEDYLYADRGPSHPSPLPLRGGDSRRWTHEVRIPDQLAIKSAELAAVFVVRENLVNAAVRKFLIWCEAQNIHIEELERGDFHFLRDRSVALILEWLV